MHLKDVPDQKLMLLFASGSKHAFKLVYDRYWKDLYNLAVRILQDDAKAEDVVQEIFVSFYESGGEKQIDNLKAYLYQSAKYQCFMQLRAGKISEKHLERMNKVIFSNIVEDEFEAHELEEILEKGISALPEKCREVFYLSRFELLPNKTIATKLNISPKTVENQITKALKSDHPLLTKNAASLAYGPGHNAFFKSKDGVEDWLTYHANENSGAGCGDDRSMRMQKFSWQNGKPFFGLPVAVGLAIKVPSGEH